MSEYTKKLRGLREAVWESEPIDIKKLTDKSVGYTDTWGSSFFPTIFGWGETIASRNILFVIRQTLLEDDVELNTVKRLTANFLSTYVPFVKWANLPEYEQILRDSSEEVTRIESREELVELLEELVFYVGRLNYWIEPQIPWDEMIKTFNSATS